MIYLDSAATTLQKPPSVARATAQMCIRDRGRGIGKMAVRGPGAAGPAHHFGITNHLYQENLGRLREKSKKRVYKRRIF